MILSQQTVFLRGFSLSVPCLFENRHNVWWFLLVVPYFYFVMKLFSVALESEFCVYLRFVQEGKWNERFFWHVWVNLIIRKVWNQPLFTTGWFLLCDVYSHTSFTYLFVLFFSPCRIFFWNLYFVVLLMKKRWTGIPVSQKSSLKNHNGTESPCSSVIILFFAVFFPPQWLTLPWLTDFSSHRRCVCLRPRRPPLILTEVLQIGKWSSKNNLVIILLSQETFEKRKKKKPWVSGWRRSRAAITPTRCDTAIRSQLKCNFVSAAAVAATRPSAQLQHSCLICLDCRQGVEAADYDCQPTLSGCFLRPRLWIF